MSTKFEDKQDGETMLFGLSKRDTKFWYLVVGIVFFFSCHNYMQELIMTLPGFKVTIVMHNSAVNLRTS